MAHLNTETGQFTMLKYVFSLFTKMTLTSCSSHFQYNTHIRQMDGWCGAVLCIESHSNNHMVSCRTYTIQLLYQPFHGRKRPRCYSTAAKRSVQSDRVSVCCLPQPLASALLSRYAETQRCLSDHREVQACCEHQEIN